MLAAMRQQGPVGGPATGPVRRQRVVDLGLAIDRGAAVPFPDQVERELRARIARRELEPGAVLPSSRALAQELEVSRGVIVEAYDRLVRQGLLVARQGAAVRVSSALGVGAGFPAGAGASPDPGAVPTGTAPATPAPAFRVSFHPAATPLGTFDRRAWGAATRTALRDGTEAELGSLDAAGSVALRTALTAQLSRSRGVVCEAADLAITAGVTDALRGLVPLLRARGGRVAVEEPGFPVHRATLLGSGLELVPVRADERGLDVAALAGAEVCAALVTPAHQMPLGVPMAPERRAALVAWARASGAWLLEDDYDGELRYDRQGVRSLHGLAPDRVLYMGTTSKVLSPALRLGWIVTPPAITDEVHAWRLTAGSTPSGVDQLIFAELVRSGAFDRGLARLRRRCAAQRAAFLEALAAADPTLVATGVAAGLHVSVRVPGVSSWALVAAAQARGVELFALDSEGAAIMLVGFGLVEPAAAPRAAAEIAAIVAAARAEAT